ncbi:MAG: hypothetical protein ABIJ37_01355 [Pseudomonadota bacterium]
MPEITIYENGEFTDYSYELPLTKELREALARIASDTEERDDRGVHKIIIDMEY